MHLSAPRISVPIISLVFACSILANAQPQRPAKETVDAQQEGGSFFDGLSTCLNCNSRDGWDYIVDELAKYSRRWEIANEQCGLYGVFPVFSRQMIYIAQFSSENRKENGGWAGELVRVSFLVAISDINRDPKGWADNWMWNDATDELVENQLRRLNPYSYSDDFHYLALVSSVGVAHLKKHLEPAFYCYFRENLQLIARTQPPRLRIDGMDVFLAGTSREHQLFLHNAVSPGFVKLGEWWIARKKRCAPAYSGGWEIVFKGIAQIVINAATDARRRAVTKAVLELYNRNQITLGGRDRLLLLYGYPTSVAAKPTVHEAENLVNVPIEDVIEDSRQKVNLRVPSSSLKP